MDYPVKWKIAVNYFTINLLFIATQYFFHANYLLISS